MNITWWHRFSARTGHSGAPSFAFPGLSRRARASAAAAGLMLFRGLDGPAASYRHITYVRIQKSCRYLPGRNPLASTAAAASANPCARASGS
jgi:hypothetical protein